MNEIATPQEFSDICPFSDAQFKEKMKELVAEDGFKHAVTWVMPDIDFDGFCKMLLQINTKKEFQENVMFDFLKLLAAKTTEGISYDNIEKVDQNKSYTMMTNHRDIVLDASFLNLALLYNHYRTTEVAIGSNLLIYKWIEDLVRINKSVIVKRDLNIRQALGAAEQLSGYIHFAITQKHESVWIAQRQGRAKDSSDTTQESLIKMLAIKGGKSTIDNLLELNIMPVAISYELDPNDYLKAREFLLKAKDPDFKRQNATTFSVWKQVCFKTKAVCISHSQTASTGNGEAPRAGQAGNTARREQHHRPSNPLQLPHLPLQLHRVRRAFQRFSLQRPLYKGGPRQI